MEKQASISYSYFRKKTSILLAGLLLTVLQILIFVIYKKKGAVLIATLTDIGNLTKRLLLDRLFVDCLAMYLLFYLTLRFKNFVNREYPVSIKGYIKSNLRYLPVLLISLLLFLPFAILLRHFIRNGFTIQADRLVSNLYNFQRLFAEYLIPFSTVGYLFFNLNLYLQRPNQVNLPELKSNNNGDKSLENNDLIEVINDTGNIMIPISDIYWIEKRARVYIVKANQDTFRIRKTIKELEVLLKPMAFLRINRSVIVNKNYLHNYSYWEYDKFILRMQDDNHTEFIVSRERMKQIKNQLTKTS